MRCTSTRPYAMLTLMHSFSTLFALLPYSSCNMAFVAAGVGPNGSGNTGLKTFPFRIDVLTSSLPSSFVLSYAVVTHSHSENRSPSLPSPESKLICSALSDLLVPEKSSLRTVFLLPNPLPFFRVQRRLLLVLHSEPPHFPWKFNL